MNSKDGIHGMNRNADDGIGMRRRNRSGTRNGNRQRESYHSRRSFPRQRQHAARAAPLAREGAHHAVFALQALGDARLRRTGQHVAIVVGQAGGGNGREKMDVDAPGADEDLPLGLHPRWCRGSPPARRAPAPRWPARRRPS